MNYLLFLFFISSLYSRMQAGRKVLIVPDSIGNNKKVNIARQHGFITIDVVYDEALAIKLTEDGKLLGKAIKEHDFEKVVYYLNSKDVWENLR